MVKLWGVFKSVFDYAVTDIGTQRARPHRGAWSKVSESARVGTDVTVGDWTEIGPNALIGDDVYLGPWAKIGANAMIGKFVRTGSYTRIAPGEIVPAFTVLGEYDLFKDGVVIPDRCSGSMTSTSDGSFTITTAFAKFEIPYGVFDWFDDADEALDIWMWGRPHSDPRKDLDQYRI